MSKIALPIAELKPALTGFAKVISKRMTLPVLNHLKIKRTKDGWIALTATNLDTFVTLRLEQPGEGEPLSLLVSYDELLKTSKACGKGDNILISAAKKNAIKIEYAIGNQIAASEVESLPVEEFPPTPKITGDAFPIPEAVRSAIHEAMECASEDATRLVLNGAYIDTSKKGAHYVVGTDGRHLYSSNSFSLPLKDSLLIPSHKFLGWKEFNNDGEWQLKVGTPQTKDDTAPLQISSRRWRYITRQIDGNYPNWRQVIPTAFATSVEFDPDSVAQMIQTIERMPDHDKINHALGIEVKRNSVNLLCKPAADQPWMPVEILLSLIKGPEATVYLNRHLLIKALEFGLLRLDIIDSLSPLRLSNEGRQIIVMPTRPEGMQPASSPANPPPAKEQNGNGEAEPVNSDTNQPAASTTAAQEERNTMARSNGNGHEPEASKPALETAVEQVEAVKASIKSAVGGLNELLDTLRQVQRDQKSTDKDVQSVRITLEKLQSVKL